MSRHVAALALAGIADSRQICAATKGLSMKFHYRAEKKAIRASSGSFVNIWSRPTGGELRDEIVSRDLDREQAYAWARKWTEEQVDLT